MSSFQSPLEEVRHYIKRFPLICIYLLVKLHFTSIAVTNTSQETSFFFNFTDFKILIFFLRTTVVSHLKAALLSDPSRSTYAGHVYVYVK